MSQLPELGDQPLSFASTGQVAHALVNVGRFHIAVEHELDAIEVLRSAHQKRAADAKSARRAADAQTGVAAVAKRDRVQAAIAFENLAGPLVGFAHQSFYPLGVLLM